MTAENDPYSSLEKKKKTLLENYKQHSFICKQGYWDEITFPAVRCPLWGSGDIISTVGSMERVMVQVWLFHFIWIVLLAGSGGDRG